MRDARTDRTGRTGLRPSRRELLVLGAGAFVVAGLPGVLRGRRRLFRRRVPVMGTIADVAVVLDDPRAAQASIDAAMRELRLVDRTMSRFRADSDVGRVNRAAGAAEPISVTDATGRVVEAAIRWARASDGAFDPCLGRATDLWDVTRRTVPPRAADVHRLAGRTLWTSIEMDRFRGRPTVRLADPDAALDLGGIAKGYGVDRAVVALRERGIRDAFVNVGGDLYALGASEDGDAWRVGVRSPVDPTRILQRLEIRDEAVATSGDYVQGFDHAGRRYHHLLDPRTGEPRRTQRHSLTVRAADCLTADAAATAAFGLDAGLAQAMLAAAGDASGIHAGEGPQLVATSA